MTSGLRKLDRRRLMTIDAAAAILEVDREQVERWLRHGRLPAVRKRSGTYVEVAGVTALVAERRGRALGYD